METTATAYIIALCLTEIYCIERMATMLSQRLKTLKQQKARKAEADKARARAFQLAKSRESLWQSYVRRVNNEQQRQGLAAYGAAGGDESARFVHKR